MLVSSELCGLLISNHFAHARCFCVMLCFFSLQCFLLLSLKKSLNISFCLSLQGTVSKLFLFSTLTDKRIHDLPNNPTIETSSFSTKQKLQNIIVHSISNQKEYCLWLVLTELTKNLSHIWLVSAWELKFSFVFCFGNSAWIKFSAWSNGNNARDVTIPCIWLRFKTVWNERILVQYISYDTLRVVQLNAIQLIFGKILYLCLCFTACWHNLNLFPQNIFFCQAIVLRYCVLYKFRSLRYIPVEFVQLYCISFTVWLQLYCVSLHPSIAHVSVNKADLWFLIYRTEILVSNFIWCKCYLSLSNV